jgi:hypothetical protein
VTPTQRSLKTMRDQGYRCAIVEHWNPFARIRQDLFGIIDVLAIKDGQTVAVQTTSASNVAARVRKIAEAEATADIRKAGWSIVVHGWRKNAAGKWTLREIDCS